MCWQKKRNINSQLNVLLGSAVSLTRCARILKVDRKTVARRLPFLSRKAKESQRREQLDRVLSKNIEFDDLETFEHTKCKPISVAMAVEAKTRRILAFSVSQAPAKGKLAKIARKKYGRREDKRPDGWEKLFQDLKPIAHAEATFTSDSNPHYPRFVKKYFPHATHRTIKGVRGSLGGQGELKKTQFDPLFNLNHTFAMLRANISRLIRKTWCTTKKLSALNDHISIYVDYHNRVLINKTLPGAHS